MANGSPKVAIRPGTERDAPALSRLRRLWIEENKGPIDDPDYEERFEAWWARTESQRRVWVAVHAGEPIAMMVLTLVERMPVPGQPLPCWGYLTNAFVTARFRNAGVGRLLLDEMLAWARQEKLARIVLHPNERAIPFYERAGFGPAEMLMMQTL
ncbi:hypothetical protein Rhe02_88420 [Rhizocola hellebori]|uniref:N-acetyltransferase domain-containing protein n=1 Tax=Rhizocola hellebori TaxID=1392758 RepID=A0A8J3QJA0_9ACTN|nr:GNAT family N-acetyltransferase [Rhizocola hellebori]GIH10775.1 hypothetical protein Rhe02_88420 [Rhizocola hellebori]